ncbi:MAG: DUF4276 family protein [Chromatiales bacterium]|nr:DUF4276 family protein [Chromatiales bacterium]
MVRLALSVEGPTEERFAKLVLVPHLADLAIWTTPILLGGRGGDVSLARIKRDLQNLARSFDYVSTLYDFYGFRSRPANTKVGLEQAILDQVPESMRSRVIPYVQMYEFEGLLFAGPDEMEAHLGRAGMAPWARKVIAEAGGNPEGINDSEQTAPSKRLLDKAPYRKSIHGPDIARDIGLARLRGRCAGFAAWVTRLEALARVP